MGDYGRIRNPKPLKGIKMANDEIYVRDILAIGAAAIAYYRAELCIEAASIPHQDLRAVIEIRNQTREALFALCNQFDATHRERPNVSTNEVG